VRPANYCRGAVLLGVVALLGLVSAARADVDTIPTLTTEFLDLHVTAVTGSATLNCQDAGNGTLTYSAVGGATGPYTGTAEESGTLVFENGVITSFDISFTIDSPAGDVVGTREPAFLDTIVCTTSGPAKEINSILQERYDATITTMTGTLHDHGAVSSGLTATLLAGQTTLSTVASFVSDREGARLDVSPTESVNPAGTTHTVTALLRDAQLHPIAGETILFNVTGSSSQTGQCTTGPDGICDFTYQGPDSPGADVISACHDFDRDGVADPGEKCDTASKAWGEATSTPGSASGGGYIDNVGGNRLVFGFGVHAGTTTPSGSCQVIDLITNLHIKCISVALFVITLTHATFFGEATVDGVATNYRIDVEDLADPGALSDTFTIHTDSGYTATGVVQHGNIQVTGA
jgi:hypothetical protein